MIKHQFVGTVLSLMSLMLLCVSACAAEPDQRSASERYVVVSCVEEDSSFQKSVAELVEIHGAESIQVASQNIESLLPELKKRQPSIVTFVIDPEDLDINLVQKLFKLSTQIDDDPFVDFPYGIITGRDGEAALKLVRAGQKRKHRKPAIKMIGVGPKQLGQSAKYSATWPLDRGAIPVQIFQSCGDSDESRDEGFLKASLSKLDHAPILLLASHGYPDGLVGGPKAHEMTESDFSGTVALNIACYNGVTSGWYEDDWKSQTIKKRKISAENSFCLQMIDAGVSSYIAYASPRPSGPGLNEEAMRIAVGGVPVGKIRQQSANRIVLAHLMTGDQVDCQTVSDGAKISSARTPGDIVKRMSLGGMLIGDPAFVPFPRQSGSLPVKQTLKRSPNRLQVDISVKSPTVHLYTGEEINYWKQKTPAMRLEGRVKLDNRIVSEVTVSQPPSEQYRYVAAVEHEGGQRYLHLKVTFPQANDPSIWQRLAHDGVSVQFDISTEPGPAPAKTDRLIHRGGSSDE